MGSIPSRVLPGGRPLIPALTDVNGICVQTQNGETFTVLLADGRVREADLSRILPGAVEIVTAVADSVPPAISVVTFISGISVDKFEPGATYVMRALANSNPLPPSVPSTEGSKGCASAKDEILVVFDVIDAVTSDVDLPRRFSEVSLEVDAGAVDMSAAAQAILDVEVHASELDAAVNRCNSLVTTGCDAVADGTRLLADALASLRSEFHLSARNRLDRCRFWLEKEVEELDDTIDALCVYARLCALVGVSGDILCDWIHLARILIDVDSFPRQSLACGPIDPTSIVDAIQRV